MKTIILLVGVVLSISMLSAESDTLYVPPATQFPRDTTVRARMLPALRLFLTELSKGAIVHAPFDTTSLENQILFDELKELRASKKYNDPFFYKAQLVNVLADNDSSYVVQLAFNGAHDSVAILRAFVSLRVQMCSGGVRVASVFAQRTKGWMCRRVGLMDFYYQRVLNDTAAAVYEHRVRFYDSLLHAPQHHAQLFCCEDLPSALHLMGIEFCSDYNGRLGGTMSQKSGDHELIINGSAGSEFGPIDPHDLWHARLRRVEDARQTNKAVDEGCAFLYGGSWGLSWDEIHKSFDRYCAQHPDLNFFDAYTKSVNIAADKALPLNMDYIINAFVVRDIEHRFGFERVRELLRCGARKKGDHNYFEALARITGVDEAHFHDYVRGLASAH